MEQGISLLLLREITLPILHRLLPTLRLLLRPAIQLANQLLPRRRKLTGTLLAFRLRGSLAGDRDAALKVVRSLCVVLDRILLTLLLHVHTENLLPVERTHRVLLWGFGLLMGRLRTQRLLWRRFYCLKSIQRTKEYILHDGTSRFATQQGRDGGWFARSGHGINYNSKINRSTPSATGFPTNASHLLAGAVGSTGFSASTSIEERAIADFFRLFTKSRAQDSRLCRFIASTLKVK